MKPHNDERKVCTIIYFKNQIECYSQETIFRNDSVVTCFYFYSTSLHCTYTCVRMFLRAPLIPPLILCGCNIVPDVE